MPGGHRHDRLSFPHDIRILESLSFLAMLTLLRHPKIHDLRSTMFAALVALLCQISLPAQSQGSDWPQWRGPTRDGVWRDTGLIESFPEEMKPLWSAPVGSGYSAPTIAKGRVYVMDRVEEPDEIERVHCFSERDGERLWTHGYACPYERVSYKAGPRCSVLVHEGRAYSLGTMGHLHCLDAEKGEVLWSKDLDEEYSVQLPIWGISASPIVEGKLLIVPVCGKDAYLVAFDLESGAEKWKAFSDRGNYAAPIVIDQGGKRVLVSWSGDRILGVDPANGALHWEYAYPPKRMPLGCASPVLHGDTLFFTGFYDGSLMLRLVVREGDGAPQLDVEKVWHRRGNNERNTDGLHSIISTPLLLGEHIYGVDSYGELRCLKQSDGVRVWENRTAVPRSRWATIHFVQNGPRTWMFNERGELILAKLSSEGYREIDRVKLLEPTRAQLNRRGGVCWSHPAFANRRVFLRNDEQLACFDLARR